MLRIFTALAGIMVVSPAHAHLGHVGELAGHAHWVGLGAVIVAGALTAAIGKITDKDVDADSEEEMEPGEETLTEG